MKNSTIDRARAARAAMASGAAPMRATWLQREAGCEYLEAVHALAYLEGEAREKARWEAALEVGMVSDGLTETMCLNMLERVEDGRGTPLAVDENYRVL